MTRYLFSLRYAFFMPASFLFPVVAATPAGVRAVRDAQAGTITFTFSRDGKEVDFDGFLRGLAEAFTFDRQYATYQSTRQVYYDFLKLLREQVIAAEMWNGFGTKASLHATPFQFVIDGTTYPAQGKAAPYALYMRGSEREVAAAYGHQGDFSDRFKVAKDLCKKKFHNRRGATTLACFSARSGNILVIPSQPLPTIFHLASHGTKAQIWSFFSVIAHVIQAYRPYIARLAIHTTPAHAQTMRRLHFRIELTEAGKQLLLRSPEAIHYNKQVIVVQQVIENSDHTHRVHTFVAAAKDPSRDIIMEKKGITHLLDMEWKALPVRDFNNK